MDGWLVLEEGTESDSGVKSPSGCKESPFLLCIDSPGFHLFPSPHLFFSAVLPTPTYIVLSGFFLSFFYSFSPLWPHGWRRDGLAWR